MVTGKTKLETGNWKLAAALLVSVFQFLFSLPVVRAQSQPFRVANLNNVRDADGFPGADAGEKIAACIADLPSAGGTCDARGLEGAQTISTNILGGVTKPIDLYLGAATYTVSTTLVSTAPIRIHGVGIYTTTLLSNSATADLLRLDAGSYDSEIYGLGFRAGVTRTAGNLLRIQGAHVDVHNCKLDLGWNGIEISGAATVIKLDHLSFSDSVNDDIYINGGAGDYYLSHINAHAGTPASQGAALHWSAGSGLYVDQFSTVQKYNGVLIDGDVSWGFFHQVIVDTTTGDGIVYKTGHAKFHEWTNSWSAGAGSADPATVGYGLYFQSGTPDTISWNGGMIRSNWKHGVYIKAGNNISVSGALIGGNNRANPAGTYDGIRVKANVNNFKLTGNTIGAIGDEVNDQGYGIKVETGRSTQYVIANNRLDGNVTSGLFDGGTGADKQVVGNEPFNGVGRLSIGSLVTGVNVASFSSTPTFDAALGNTQKIVLTGSVTSSTLSNAQTGEPINFIICQDGSGSHTFVWPTNVKGAMTIGATLSTCSAQSFIFDGSNAYALGAGVTNM